MQPVNLIQQPLTQNMQPQPAGLQTGQIILGKINKIYPNQTAEVQIGNQKIMAVLDAPLKVGERYWLQVQPGEGKLHLKLLNPAPGFENIGLKGAAEQLVAHLAVPQGKESLELARFLLKNQLPVTKENFELSLRWLKTSANTGGTLANIKTMHAMNLPFTNDVFAALQSLGKAESLSSDLTKLHQQISRHIEGTDTEILQQVKGLLEKVIVPKQNQNASNALDKLLASWLDLKTPLETQKSAYTILQKAGFIPQSINEGEFIERIILASQNDKSQLPPVLKESLSLILQYAVAKQKGAAPEAEKLLTLFNQLLSQSGKVNVELAVKRGTESLSKLDRPDSPLLRGNEVVQLTKKLLLTLLVSNGEERITEQKPINKDILFSAVNGSHYKPEQARGRLAEMIHVELEAAQQTVELEPVERRLLKQIIAAAERPIDFTKGAPTSEFVKDIVKLLGLNMEHSLANGRGMETKASTEELATLKPLLMKLLVETQHPPIKDAAEQVLNRITAQQLLSQDNGPLQNIFMQLPLNLSGFQTDLTLQWSGRKKSSGAIDPDYCRVLFYLDLEQMRETVIDMQIQNRILKISVINEHFEKLEQLSRPLTESLKNNLGDMNYRLSSLVFEGEAKQISQKQNISAGSKPYSGVDIRI
ncbi:hypothetical protein [Bacillus sp. CECT 9360]|uniref:hypothetical protein n=1 Tax=Bacillus sp. CECT 9360 TaxID=2845821 RepID=UPI001E3EE123|nr:hypothetical protein [Bacillus sp. CECT 9360]CAH0346965.1 hypothetical protein BCI9360_03336 [Bacillus sp. CECT 9360]